MVESLSSLYDVPGGDFCPLIIFPPLGKIVKLSRYVFWIRSTFQPDFANNPQKEMLY
jgi:hypothetical protein